MVTREQVERARRIAVGVVSQLCSACDELHVAQAHAGDREDCQEPACVRHLEAAEAMVCLAELADDVLAQRPASDEEVEQLYPHDVDDFRLGLVQARRREGFAAGAASRLLLTPPVEAITGDTPGEAKPSVDDPLRLRAVKVEHPGLAEPLYFSIPEGDAHGYIRNVVMPQVRAKITGHPDELFTFTEVCDYFTDAPGGGQEGG